MCKFLGSSTVPPIVEPYPSCTSVDYDDPVQAQSVYDLYLGQYTQSERNTHEAQMLQEANARNLQKFGTTDLAIIGEWNNFPLPLNIPPLANPNDADITSGLYGWGHSAESLYLSLYQAQLSGASDSQLIQLGEELKIKWFVREAQARCRQTAYPPTEEWLNPLAWTEDGNYGTNEDSRLDYYMPLLFIDWFLQNEL